MLPQDTQLDQPHQLGDYQLVRILGKGSFSRVSLAVHLPTGYLVALKLVHKKAIDNEYIRRHIYREAEVLKRTKHANIITLIRTFETDDFWALVLEYAPGGPLIKHIYNHGKLSEKESACLALQLTSAAEHLHAVG
eukprot:Colp12_sorted_trinity150504_noHs@21405